MFKGQLFLGAAFNNITKSLNQQETKRFVNIYSLVLSSKDTLIFIFDIQSSVNILDRLLKNALKRDHNLFSSSLLTTVYALHVVRAEVTPLTASSVMLCYYKSDY